MCKHRHYIYNPYSRKKVLVNCGKCSECQQEKATQRANRIRNHCPHGMLAFFVTLTYSNDYVPYIRLSDLRSYDISSTYEIPVYRNNECRVVYSKRNGCRFKRDEGVREIHRCFIPDKFRYDSSLFGLTPLRGMSSDCIGVCLNSDIQKFFKRLSINLKRKYNYDKPLNYWYCSEYGSFFHRPHFHALIFFPYDWEDRFRNAIFESWSYSIQSVKEAGLEIAKNVASYLSSYCAKHARSNEFEQNSPYKQKHACSLGFGVVLDCFNLSEILSRADRGNLYYYSQKKLDGKSSVIKLLYPSYVIGRYFPKFKGCCKLSLSRLESLLRFPERANEYLTEYELGNYLYTYTPKETYRIYVRLENAYLRFHQETGLNRYDYAYYYIKIWQLRSSLVIRDSYEMVETETDWLSFYENGYLLEFMPECFSAYLTELVHNYPDLLVSDYNKLPDVQRKDLKLLDVHSRIVKQRMVTDYCLDSANVWQY